jgi:SAM-dependent methyltransferase
MDVGCGTGVLTQAIIDKANPRSVVGVEPSDFIQYAIAHIKHPDVSFRQGSAEALPVDAGTIDVAVSGLVLNFVPDPLRGVKEMVRVARPGSLVAGYVWDYAGKMELMRYFWDAATELDPAAAELDEGPRFPICAPGPLEELFLRGGLSEVEVKPIDISTKFRDFDDYWDPFLGGQGPAPGYATSLSEERRDALRERLRELLPISTDGSIDLIARAWAAKGRTN